MEQEAAPSVQTEKVEWILFLGDDYRGPLTWHQVLETVANEGVGREVHIWKEGMSEWVPFAQFQPVIQPIVPDYASASLTSTPEQPLPALVNSTTKSFISAKVIYIAILLIVAAGYGFYTYKSMTAFLEVRGVNREEYKLLRQTALAPTREQGILGVMILARGSEKSPQFHIASNLPEGSEIEVRLQGIPETLVNHQEVVGSTNGRLHKGYLRADKFKLWYVDNLPRGEYNVWLLHKNKVITQQQVFLGGIKDEDYKYQLDLYHATIRLQAQAELEEIRQLTVNLGRQLKDTNAAFARGKRWWPEFHESWLAQHEQISYLFKNWMPNSSEKGFYYGHLYRSIRDASELILKFHNEQNAQMLKTKKRQPASEKITEQTLVLEKVLASIRDSITLVEQKAAAGFLPKNVPTGSR